MVVTKITSPIQCSEKVFALHMFQIIKLILMLEI